MPVTSSKSAEILFFTLSAIHVDLYHRHNILPWPIASGLLKFRLAAITGFSSRQLAGVYKS
jgi:hypothetical protein